MKKNIGLLSLLFVLLFALGCNGQPKSNYKASWNPVQGASNYIVFLWQGQDSSSCPFVEDQDYLGPANNINSFITGTPSITESIFNLNNDGKYIIVAVAAKNSAGFYSALSKSYSFKKGTVPNKPGFITIIKQ